MGVPYSPSHFPPQAEGRGHLPGREHGICPSCPLLNGRSPVSPALSPERGAPCLPALSPPGMVLFPPSLFPTLSVPYPSLHRWCPTPLPVPSKGGLLNPCLFSSMERIISPMCSLPSTLSPQRGFPVPLPIPLHGEFLILNILILPWPVHFHSSLAPLKEDPYLPNHSPVHSPPLNVS